MRHRSSRWISNLLPAPNYANPRDVPFVCGIDGVGHLADGQRVFFGGCRSPFGAMAERTVVPKAFAFPVPDSLSDELAAALPNPGVSAWLALTFRAKLARGENVLVLGGTGVAGRLAVQIAKLLGTGRVVAAGRDQNGLAALRELGADATIRLDGTQEELGGFSPNGRRLRFPDCDRLRLGSTYRGISKCSDKEGIFEDRV